MEEETVETNVPATDEVPTAAEPPKLPDEEGDDDTPTPDEEGEDEENDEVEG